MQVNLRLVKEQSLWFRSQYRIGICNIVYFRGLRVTDNPAERLENQCVELILETYPDTLITASIVLHQLGMYE